MPSSFAKAGGGGFLIGIWEFWNLRKERFSNIFQNGLALAARSDSWSSPRAETPSHFITMGIHEDLTEATKMATREMIDFLVAEKHLNRDDAYMLTSVAGDLLITQVVDGNKGVHAMMIPKAIFKSSTSGSRQ